MKRSSSVIASFLVAAFAVATAPVAAQSRRQPAAPRGGGAPAVARAVPRGGPAPRVVGGYPGGYPAARGYYRPYPYYPAYPYRPYYPYHSGVTIGVGIGFGYPYGYAYGAYGWGYPYGWAYPYAYSYPYPAYYGGYYGPYGGVRIKDAPPNAEVLVDGYYVGLADDFDNPFQQLTLEGGAHKIEVRAPNAAPLNFEVNVLPGQTITYRAR